LRLRLSARRTRAIATSAPEIAARRSGERNRAALNHRVLAGRAAIPWPAGRSLAFAWHSKRNENRALRTVVLYRTLGPRCRRAWRQRLAVGIAQLYVRSQPAARACRIGGMPVLPSIACSTRSSTAIRRDLRGQRLRRCWQAVRLPDPAINCTCPSCCRTAEARAGSTAENPAFPSFSPRASAAVRPATRRSRFRGIAGRVWPAAGQRRMRQRLVADADTCGSAGRGSVAVVVDVTDTPCSRANLLPTAKTRIGSRRHGRASGVAPNEPPM